MASVLIVEDNKNVRLLTAARLKPYFEVCCAGDGLEALDILYDRHIDLIVADIMMPNMDGFELIRRLREEGSQIPVILLTARQSFEDKKEGFLSGSDDYMTKPIHYDELILRIHALLRRAGIADEQTISRSGVTINSKSYTVSWDSRILTLPKKEFLLLFKLLSYPGTVFTKGQLLDEVWGYSSESSEDTVKTHINRLRGSLKECPGIEIVTVKGIGYKAEFRGDGKRQDGKDGTERTKGEPHP